MPLRFKLTLAFTGVMAVLLTAAGIALSVLVANNLDNTIDDGLEARAGDAAAVVAARSNDGSVLDSTGESFAQVLDADGTVIDTTTGAGATSLLDRESVAKARSGADVIVEGHTANGSAVRLLARRAPRTQEIVVVGEPLAQRERALGALHALLAIGGPIALLIASVVG
jgi:hypothetical protein